MKRFMVTFLSCFIVSKRELCNINDPCKSRRCHTDFSRAGSRTDNFLPEVIYTPHRYDTSYLRDKYDCLLVPENFLVLRRNVKFSFTITKIHLAKRIVSSLENKTGYFSYVMFLQTPLDVLIKINHINTITSFVLSNDFLSAVKIGF